MNDMCNGEGKLCAVSGASYKGLWINGQPACTAVKLVIIRLEEEEENMRIAPGQSFSLSVECHTDDDELMTGTNNCQCLLVCEIDVKTLLWHYGEIICTWQ